MRKRPLALRRPRAQSVVLALTVFAPMACAWLCATTAGPDAAPHANVAEGGMPCDHERTAAPSSHSPTPSPVNDERGSCCAGAALALPTSSSVPDRNRPCDTATAWIVAEMSVPFETRIASNGKNWTPPRLDTRLPAVMRNIVLLL